MKLQRVRPALVKQQCPGCHRLVTKRPRRGKAFYAHKCPHGVPCVFGHGGLGGHGFNGPALGGPCYCAECVRTIRLGGAK